MGRHIALVGGKHSGKTTAGRYLVATHGYRKLALADPLKDLAVDMLNTFHAKEGLPPIDRAFLDEHKDAVFVPFLQWLGSDYGRDFLHTPTRWIDKFLDETVASPVPILCDDCRFPNEADTLRLNGFIIVQLMRSDNARAASLEAAGISPEILRHQSETNVSRINADVLVAPFEDVQNLYVHLDWVKDFQALCNELKEMSSYVPYGVAPGYNADFNDRAFDLVDRRQHQDVTIILNSPDYVRMYNKIQQHAES